MPYLLGVDAGGTKTVAAVCDDSGRVVGSARAGGANYQDVGVMIAARELAAAVSDALAAGGVSRGDVVAACFGVAGADRDVDFRAIRDILENVSPTRRYSLVNDTIVALRAGTSDGVGVCCIGGTGANCIGRNRLGVIKKVGGLGWISGDSGSAGEIVGDAITAALWGREGRGPETTLYARLCTALGLTVLDDVVELGFFHRESSVDVGTLAPLVFAASREGDTVARELLERHGRGVARAALCAIRGLFSVDEEVEVVLGGSVLVHGDDDALREAFEEMLLESHPQARVVHLEVEPVLGALLLARDTEVGQAGSLFFQRLRETFAATESA